MIAKTFSSNRSDVAAAGAARYGWRRRRPLVGLLALTAVAGGVLTFGVSSGVGATPSTAYDLSRVENPSSNPNAGDRWGERNATMPDLNGDGKNEILVGDLSADYGGFKNAGRDYMLNGADRRVLYSVDPPEIQNGANFGFFIAVIGDVNGDGKADFASGTDSQDTTPAGVPCSAPPAGFPPTVPAPVGCNRDQGKAWVFSGATGRLLYALNNPNPQANARFGSRIGRAGDANGNGTPDIIVGASNNDLPAGCGNDPTSLPVPAAQLPAGCRVNEGEAFIFEGATGAPIRTLNLPPADQAPTTTAPCSSNCGSFGLAVQGPGDVNGDGITDQLVDAASFSYDTTTKGVCTDQKLPTCNPGQGAMYLFSGKDGAFIRRIDDPAPQADATFGFQDAAPLSPGDVNGDGAAEIFGNGFAQNGPAGDEQGRAWVFDGKTGDVRYELLDPTPIVGGQFAFSEDKTDYNQDGTPDIYAGKSPHDVSAQPCTPMTASDCGSDQSGGTFIFNGRDGSLLKSLVLPPSDAQKGEKDNLGSNLGWSLAAPGDLNGDGQPDYVAGSPWSDVGADPACQASTPGCTKDQGRDFVFLSSAPAPGGGGGGGGGGPTVTPPTVKPKSGKGRSALSHSTRCARRGKKKVVCLTSIRVRLSKGTSTKACSGTVRVGVRVQRVVTVVRRGRKRHVVRTSNATYGKKLGSHCRVTGRLDLARRGLRGHPRVKVHFLGNRLVHGTTTGYRSAK